MKIFYNNTELKDQLEAANIHIDEIEGALNKRESEIVDMSEKIAAMSGDMEKMSAMIQGITEEKEKIEAEKAEIESKLEESQEAQASFESKVSAAAAARMQELGVSEPIESTNEDDTLDLYTQYKKLKATNPAAAGAFWRENEAKIKASI